MKGILQKTEQGWVIRYDKRTWQDPSAEDGEIPLHPADVEQINKDSQVFDNIEARIAAYPEVEFMIVNKLWGVNDDIISYAKLINQVSDVGKMVEDDVKKLAEEYATYYEDNKDIKGAIQWGKRYNGFVDGYNKAKETLYTEEQVISIVEKSRTTGLTAEYIMLSLKQHKL